MHVIFHLRIKMKHEKNAWQFQNKTNNILFCPHTYKEDDVMKMRHTKMENWLAIEIKSHFTGLISTENE